MSTTPSQLIAEFNAQRSDAAFAALVHQHVNLVFATALRQVGDRCLAEEVTQNVFLALAPCAGKLGGHPTLAGWLYQTTLNKSRNALRTEFRRQRRELVAVEQALARAAGDSIWAAMLPLLDEALLELAEPDRLAVVLHYLEGRTFQEVAATLGVGEDAARKRAGRSLENLTSFFRRHGFDCPALAVGPPLFALATQPAPAGLANTISLAVLTQHSAAAAYTSTVFKGALKFMAWTKTKTALVAGLVVLLGTGATSVVRYHSAHRPHLQKETAVMDLRSDGTIQGTETSEKINFSGRPWRGLVITTVTDSQELDTLESVADGAGQPVPFTTTKKDGKIFYSRHYGQSIPPGGKLVETVAGIDHDSIRGLALGDFEGDSNTRRIETIRLPEGAVLLDKEPVDAAVSTNGDRIEIKFDKLVPAKGRLPVSCRYRLASQ
jgi:RNA polymerase sigma factor (sigma-70 family)